MKTLLLELWTDPAKFRAALRALIVGLATASNTGLLPSGGRIWWFSQFALVVAVGIPASRKD